MSDEQLKEIYENAKRNSVGRDKVANAFRYKTQAVLKKSMALVLTLFLAMACVGCGISNNSNLEEKRTAIEQEYAFLEDDESGYSAAEVGVYEKLRVMDLLDDNNMDDYDAAGNKRDYHYSAIAISLASSAPDNI